MKQMSNTELNDKIEAFLARKTEKYPELRSRQATITDIRDTRSLTERLRQTFTIARPATLR